jgi:cell wall-associated NlpC family hydrolase
MATVLAIAGGYAAAAAPDSSSDAAARAAAFTRDQRGVPYVWGGDGSPVD